MFVQRSHDLKCASWKEPPVVATVLNSKIGVLFWNMKTFDSLLKYLPYFHLCPMSTTLIYLSSVLMCSCSISLVWLFAILWTVACQAPASLRFSRQENWSGLSWPPPEDLPNPGIELTSPVSPALAVRCFTSDPLGKPYYSNTLSIISLK